MNYYLRRFLSFYIDLFVISIIYYPALYLYTKFALGENALIEFPDLELALLFGTFGFFIYYLIFEGLLESTIGKKITGLKLTGLENLPIRQKLIQVLLRTLSRLIPFEPISLFLTGEGKMMWHDRISKIKVELCKSK
jgi:uncharacterized RDD family membrane protein YckC